MAGYVDGCVIPVPKRKVAAYRRIARTAGKVWRDHGALDYVECIGDAVANCNPERASLHLAALAYSEENKVSYAQAAIAVYKK